jgi:O-antigen/teichoic acid export membrane protein
MLTGTVGVRRGRILGAVLSFFFGQGTLQALNALSAIFLVRALSVEHYAQFGLAYGFQMAAAVLMDLGFTGTIIPLVGDRVDDRARVGRYLRAAKYLRDRTFLILGPLATLAFLGLMHRRHWSWEVQAGLVFSVLLALYASGPASYYGVPALIYGRLRAYYLPQNLFSLARLAVYVVLRQLGGALNACTAAAIYGLNVLANGLVFRKTSRALVEWPERDQPEVNREVVRYILPAIPALAFFAFRSQIALFLISIFGQTVNVAEVAALARLAQLFTIFSTFNLVIIEPRVARLSADNLPATYGRLVLLALGLCAGVVVLAFEFPSFFLWVLGRKYMGLSHLVGWVVMTACVTYLANLFYVMNRARKWLFWRGTILEIALTVGVDICFIVLIGVRDTRQAVFFTLAASLCSFVTHCYIGIYGFLRGPRNSSDAEGRFLAL